MVATTSGTSLRLIHDRIDPSRDGRRLTLFFVGLVVFYLGMIIVAQPEVGGGEDELDKFVLGVMFAPTVGAILACVFGPGLIRFGKPSWWLVASFLPALVVFPITLIASVSGEVEFHSSQFGSLLVMLVPLSLVVSIAALGEEIGWRGFLWPLMRRRLTFVMSAAIMFVLWWIYHAPLTIAGWYGFNGGLPAFSVMLVGFVLFVGVLTERSRSIWPSVLAHGCWNAFVAENFASSGEGGDPAFTGSR